MTLAASTLGLIGHPPVSSLTSHSWDIIIVGAGHNGLTCAAYLARAGKRVVVLEGNERIGGACTLEETWPGYRISPCAYLCGLLHPLVIDELDLPGHGFEWIPADAGMFVPFEDGASIQLWSDPDRCLEEVRRLSPGDVDGWQEMGRFVAHIRNALRRPEHRDLWLSLEPTREEIANRLDHDADALAFLFEWSMSDFVERFLDDERLHLALLGQGVIGTNASPFDPGTAAIRFHHSSGRSIGRFCENIPDAVEQYEILGPPDIEKKIGITGGHIFHGECLPEYMWDRRLSSRTPMPGFYLCGAGTHPGGSVTAVTAANGRNAAMAVLEDLRAS